ncbi:MAG: hypothetical protein Q9175_001713 [Cornicularia normoerica]
MLVDWYEPKDPAPATAPVSGPQVLPEVRKPVDPEHTASRERRLAPAPLRPETKATDPEMPTKPVARGRKDLPRKGVVGKTIQKKVDHACVRCRKMKQKCGGEKPHCGRCRGRGQTCYYSPNQRQREFARRKTADNANVTPEPLEQPGPMESAPVRNRNRTPTLRRLLPYPEERGAALGGITAGSDLPTRYPEQFDLAFGYLDARPNEFSQYSQEPAWTFGDVETRPNGFLQRPQQPDFTNGGLGARPTGTLQYSQQPNWTFEDSEPQLNGLLQGSQEPRFALGRYPSLLFRPPPNLGELDLAFGASTARPYGTLQYTRDPSMIYAGATAPPGNVWPRPNEPGMEAMLNHFPSASPNN